MMKPVIFETVDQSVSRVGDEDVRRLGDSSDLGERQGVSPPSAILWVFAQPQTHGTSSGHFYRPSPPPGEGGPRAVEGALQSR